MLAQNFKTPADLKITDAEFDALAKVLGMLERDELQHVKPLQNVPNGFNMADWHYKQHCGSACCIGGWVQRLFKIDLAPCGGKTPALDRLFYPHQPGTRLSQITTAQAAVAVRNYLTHGEPRWEEALETA